MKKLELKNIIKKELGKISKTKLEEDYENDKEWLQNLKTVSNEPVNPKLLKKLNKSPKSINIEDLKVSHVHGSKYSFEVLINKVPYYGFTSQIVGKYFVTYLTSIKSQGKRQAPMAIKMEVEEELNK